MSNKHLFPWWAGYLLINPLRKLSLDPDKILGQYIKEGMTVIDAGCAMGYFSLPAARMAGPSGLVLCVDVQERMLKTLEKRAVKAKVRKQVKTRLCRPDWLMIDDFYGKVDIAIAFGVVHEVPDKTVFLSDLNRALRSGGVLIMGEPRMPVPAPAFSESVRNAAACGFDVESLSEYRSCRIAIFRKP